jgi:hypothetical protein
MGTERYRVGIPGGRVAKKRPLEEHKDHWHVSAEPLGSGTPPCAP